MTDPLTPSSGIFEGQVHLLPVRIYYEDTDFSGVVYHANYLRYLERARSDYFRLAGIHHRALAARADPLAFAVVEMRLNFRAPARVDDALVVATTFDSVRGARMFARQRVLRGTELLCEAEVTAAVIGMDGRPRRPPREMLDLLEPWLTENDAGEQS
jgi:acyl-CoA thioester hydrolase